MVIKIDRIFYTLIWKPNLVFYYVNYFIRCSNFSKIVNKVIRKYLLNYYLWWKKIFKRPFVNKLMLQVFFKKNYTEFFKAFN